MVDSTSGERFRTQNRDPGKATTCDLFCVHTRAWCHTRVFGPFGLCKCVYTTLFLKREGGADNDGGARGQRGKGRKVARVLDCQNMLAVQSGEVQSEAVRGRSGGLGPEHQVGDRAKGLVSQGACSRCIFQPEQR